MSRDFIRTTIGTRGGVIALGAIQWTLLTAALGALVIYTDRSLEGMVEFHIDSGYTLVGAAVIGFLLGATIERNRVLIPAVFLCCLAAASMYAAVLFLPVWTGTIIGTTGLQNFASTRVLLYFGLTIVPVSMGALAGRLIGPLIPGGDLLAGRGRGDDDNWWQKRSRRSRSTPGAPERP